ncbi:MAG: nucleoside-diphosphate kinase [bacterium]
MSESTLLMIKPDAVERNLIGKIIDRLETAGFVVAELRLVRLRREDGERFYQVHAKRPFFYELVEFISSGPVVAMKLEKDNAVSDLRDLIGATNPAEANCGTIRQCYALSLTRNSVHASDSPENARTETAFFFPE